jgi:tetratricopeptide (TPR) repeat protein
MRSNIPWFILAAMLSTLPIGEAFAEKVKRSSSSSSADDDDEDESNREDIDEGTMLRNQAPQIEGLPEEDDRVGLREMLQEQHDRPYPNVVYRGAEVMQLEPEFVHAAREGLEKIYLRDYPGAMNHFGRMDEEHPGTALGSIGRGLVYQALMLENFDYDYEPQYETNWAAAKAELVEALENPGNEIWEHFMMVGVIGVEAIHATRRYNYVGALSKAMEAMRYLERCKELAPDFPDLVLADGINNYWRSVVALNTKLIPDGEDRRAEGIAQMKYVETNAIFVSAPTTLALTYTYLEERDMKRALGTASRGHQLYPDNVINNLVLARIYIYMRRFQQSEAICQEILEDAPDNERVHYYLGLIYSRTKRMDQAIAELEQYLTYDLIDEYRATTLYRLGGFHYRKKRYAQAEEYYKEAVNVNKHKGAKRRLERMKRLKKEGVISY